MNTTWKIGAAFVAGVVAATAVRSPFVEPAVAQTAQPAEQYMVWHYDNSGPNEQTLNNLAAQGWKVRTGTNGPDLILVR